MFKLLVLCSAFVAMAASLKMNPEGLRVFWDLMSKQIKGRQQLIKEQIDSIAPTLQVFVENAKSQLDADLTEAAKPFWQGIEELEKEAQERDAVHCIDIANEQLYKYNASLYSKFHRAFDDLNVAADAAVAEAAAALSDADKGLAGLEERVINCSNLECATHLESDVINMSNTVMIRIDNALQQANNEGLILLLFGLEDQKLDQSEYANFSGKLLEDARECVRKD